MAEPAPKRRREDDGLETAAPASASAPISVAAPSSGAGSASATPASVAKPPTSATATPTPAAAAKASVASAAPADAAPAPAPPKSAKAKPPPHMVPGQEVSQFLEVLDSFTPTIPDAVINHYLRRSGFKSSDPRVMRLISLATQKFVADVATDAMEYCKAGQVSAAAKKGTREKQLVLTSGDLVNALNDHGIGVVKPPYYA